MVFLTPYGDASLYVASRTPAGFVVRETHGGRSTLAFDYRIVAQRYGVQTGRLPHLATISSHQAQLHFAAIHPNATSAYANADLQYSVAPAVKEGSRRPALLAQARLAAQSAHRRKTLPPTPPAGFLAGLQRRH